MLLLISRYDVRLISIRKDFERIFTIFLFYIETLSE